jgi:hypothetical protein
MVSHMQVHAPPTSNPLGISDIVDQAFRQRSRKPGFAPQFCGATYDSATPLKPLIVRNWFKLETYRTDFCD